MEKLNARVVPVSVAFGIIKTINRNKDAVVIIFDEIQKEND